MQKMVHREAFFHAPQRKLWTFSRRKSVCRNVCDELAQLIPFSCVTLQRKDKLQRKQRAKNRKPKRLRSVANKWSEGKKNLPTAHEWTSFYWWWVWLFGWQFFPESFFTRLRAGLPMLFPFVVTQSFYILLRKDTAFCQFLCPVSLCPFILIEFRVSFVNVCFVGFFNFVSWCFSCFLWQDEVVGKVFPSLFHSFPVPITVGSIFVSCVLILCSNWSWVWVAWVRFRLHETWTSVHYVCSCVSSALKNVMLDSAGCSCLYLVLYFFVSLCEWRFLILTIIVSFDVTANVWVMFHWIFKWHKFPERMTPLCTSNFELENKLSFPLR